MARYFFDLSHDRDEVGTDFADMAAVRKYALRYCSELMRDTYLGTHGKDYWRVDVRNEMGAVIFHVTSELTPVQADAFSWLTSKDASGRAVEPGWGNAGMPRRA